MLDPTEVCAILKEHADLEDVPVTKLLPICKRALCFVESLLKEDVDSDSPRIAALAAAEARVQLFVRMLSAPDRFRSYKAGDMTIQRDLEKEFAIEKALRDEAFLKSADILKDGGFYFAAHS